MPSSAASLRWSFDSHTQFRAWSGKGSGGRKRSVAGRCSVANVRMNHVKVLRMIEGRTDGTCGTNPAAAAAALGFLLAASPSFTLRFFSSLALPLCAHTSCYYTASDSIIRHRTLGTSSTAACRSRFSSRHVIQRTAVPPEALKSHSPIASEASEQAGSLLD